MSQVRFISDLHFGHEKMNAHRCENHDEWLIKQWNSVVKKQDLTWVLGDVCFKKDKLELVRRLNGIKHLVLGNHDDMSLNKYLEVFHKVHGFFKYKGFWVSHAPIRETVLRGKMNIHGHTHGKVLVNGDYICVCVEALDGKPILFEDIKKAIK